MTANTLPYVVSADIRFLLRGWAASHSFVLPSDAFFADLREEFSAFMKKVFTNFELVLEEELSAGIAELVRQTPATPVSLEKTYHATARSLEVARLVNDRGDDCGIGPRAGAKTLLRQFKVLKRAGLKEVTLIDDVIFSGGFMARLVHLLNKMSLRVPTVCVGIGIEEGVSKLRELNCEVRCVRRYKAVIDEVCERDFYPGTPLSGRLVAKSQNVGMPYILPFGKPKEWATIPEERHRELSRFCLMQTARLFSEIERSSGKTVITQVLPRQVHSLRNGVMSFTEVLREVARTV